MLIIIRKFPIICLLIFAFNFRAFALNELSTSASSAVLIDADTHEVLYDNNPHEVRSMASTTKIMTALIAIESGRLDETVTVKDKIYIEGTAIGFSEGDKITLEDLCYGMLLESGNDAAVLTASFISGNEAEFSKLMNKKAEEIGMNNTNFVTASGLDDEEHYTTAYDMALLGAYAVKNERFREICSSKNYIADFVDSDKIRHFTNHNKLLWNCEGVYGIKTGFTRKSGRCLVSACERNGKTLVAVTLNAPDDWNDHRKLYNYGYSLYSNEMFCVDLPEKVYVAGSDKKEIRISCTYDEKIFIRKESQLNYKIYLDNFLYAPINKNDIVGKIIIYSDDHIVSESFVTALENAEVIDSSEEYKQSLSERFTDFIFNLFAHRKG